jgi:hypothetical protein
MKCTKNKIRKMYEKMDPKKRQYLSDLKADPEKGFYEQVKTELGGIKDKMTHEMFQKIYTHYSLLSVSEPSVYSGMSSKQVNPNSDDFYVIEFLSTIEFWEGFFDESLETDYVKSANRMLGFFNKMAENGAKKIN